MTPLQSTTPTAHRIVALFSMLVCVIIVTVALPITPAYGQVEKLYRVQLDRVRDFIIKGDYDKAAERLQGLSKTFRSNPDTHYRLGDARFMNCQMPEAVEAYDKAIRLQSRLGPMCWQRGLALYYDEDFEGGRDQFEHHQTVNRQDVENSVWHLLCNAKIVGVEEARESMIPISGDQRVPMPEVFELFAGTGSVEKVMAAAEAVGGETARRRDTPIYYAHFYIGLYYEMMDKPDESLKSMKEAAKINPLANDLLMGTVADVHLKLRRDRQHRNNRK